VVSLDWVAADVIDNVLIATDEGIIVIDAMLDLLKHHRPVLLANPHANHVLSHRQFVHPAVPAILSLALSVSSVQKMHSTIKLLVLVDVTMDTHKNIPPVGSVLILVRHVLPHRQFVHPAIPAILSLALSVPSVQKMHSTIKLFALVDVIMDTHKNIPPVGSVLILVRHVLLHQLFALRVMWASDYNIPLVCPQAYKLDRKEKLLVAEVLTTTTLLDLVRLAYSLVVKNA
jgi:hypothetical protein